ncbi:uncharacterized protein [Mytilus edulis]|uniref:uncharacterized protein n=1 Tax=Mytilus edulis TaxID=6550 RepID=UPI0039F01D40
MEGLFFITIIYISNVLIPFNWVLADCNYTSGPSGDTDCIQWPNYYTYQWSTCVTDEYMRAKTNNRWECKDRTVVYCYFQCMAEVHDENIGPVSPDCSCSDGEQHKVSNLTLPTRCYSPSGSDCTWYQDCLERKYKCSESKDDYAMAFATKFCNLYTEHYGKFTTDGQTWVNAVRKCLQVTLVPLLRPWRPFSCSEVKQFAFNSHVPCYVQPNEMVPEVSICNLDPSDVFSVFWTIKSSLVMSVDSSLETINGLWNTMKQCIFFIKYSFDGDIRNIQMTIEHKGLEVIRRRRSVSEKSIRLSNDIVDHIAKQLNWDKRGIVWFSYDDNSTSIASKKLLLNIFLADGKKYDLDPKNVLKSDLNATVADFQTKVQTGGLFGDTKDVSFKVITSQGCVDANCDVISFNVTTDPFVKDTSDHTIVKKNNNKIYIIIGMSSLGLLVLVTLVSAIFCSHWKHGFGKTVK